jgi:ribosome-associated protein
MNDAEPSKSARKREAQRVKALGTRLAELTDAQRRALTLPDALETAIDAYRRITAHEAKRRQAQYIGRLMRGIDVTAIEQALADIAQRSGQARHAHHALEQWREQLLADDAAASEYLSCYPATDRPRLRTLVRAARADVDGTRGAQRALFRFLRDNAAAHDAGPDASVPPTVT